MVMVSNWVLLRGLGRGAGHWGGFPALLQASFPQARLLLPELPGNGARFRERSPPRVSELVEDLRSGLREQGVAPPYHLLALSLGAMLAADWAHRYPQEIAAAVLINTSLRPFSPAHHRLRPGAAARLLTLPACSDIARERCVLALTSRLASDSSRTLARWVALQQAQPVASANLLRQLLAAARYRAPSAAPQPPLLLLAGRRDGLANPCCSQALAQAWHAPLAEHPLAGHDLPLDDGAWVVAQLKRWLQANPDPSTQTGPASDAGPVAG